MTAVCANVETDCTLVCTPSVYLQFWSVFVFTVHLENHHLLFRYTSTVMYSTAGYHCRPSLQAITYSTGTSRVQPAITYSTYTCHIETAITYTTCRPYMPGTASPCSHQSLSTIDKSHPGHCCLMISTLSLVKSHASHFILNSAGHFLPWSHWLYYHQGIPWKEQCKGYWGTIVNRKFII